MIKQGLALTFLFLLVVSCGGSSGGGKKDNNDDRRPRTTSDQLAQGKLLGQQFVFATGSLTYWDDENPKDGVVLSFYEESLASEEACGNSVIPNRAITVVLPKKSGNFSLGASSQTSAAFTEYSGSEINTEIVTEGSVKIDSVNENSVSGEVSIGNGDNSLEGKFKVYNCL